MQQLLEEMEVEEEEKRTPEEMEAQFMAALAPHLNGAEPTNENVAAVIEKMTPEQRQALAAQGRGLRSELMSKPQKYADETAAYRKVVNDAAEKQGLPVEKDGEHLGKKIAAFMQASRRILCESRRIVLFIPANSSVHLGKKIGHAGDRPPTPNDLTRGCSVPNRVARAPCGRLAACQHSLPHARPWPAVRGCQHRLTHSLAVCQHPLPHALAQTSSGPVPHAVVLNALASAPYLVKLALAEAQVTPPPLPLSHPLRSLSLPCSRKHTGRRLCEGLSRETVIPVLSGWM